MTKSLSISYTSETSKEPASAFAKKHNYPCVIYSEVTTPLNLNYNYEYVELRDIEKNISIHIDFLGGTLAHRQQYGGGRGQSIAKAIGLKQGTPPPTVIDATAGLAKDAYLLACLGCSMTLLERSPIIAELINDAIHRASDHENFKSILETGFKVINQSSIDYLTKLSNSELPDVSPVAS